MIGFLIASAAILAMSNGAYDNEYDKVLNFQCTDTQSVNRVQSLHSNGAEDRRFDLSCLDVWPDSTGDTPSCFWTDYANSYDQLLHFSCPTNNFISGMNSVHDNGAEDRKWKFYCCSLASLHLVDCDFSGWTNEFDQPQDYTVPKGKVMKGVISVHDNGPEDRRYEYETCKIAQLSDGAVIG